MSVGMPGWIALDWFGSQLWSAFGVPAYHVGSSLTKKRDWHDVDVVTILSDEDWEAWGFGKPNRPGDNDKWRAMRCAFTLLGHTMTGLPIDFKIQQQSWANENFKPEDGCSRRAIGLVPLWRRD